MDNEYIEFSDRTLDDCITAACRKFSVTSENLDYEVVDQGSTGFMGFNSRNAVIRAKVKGNAYGVAAASGDVLNDVHSRQDGAASSVDSYDSYDENSSVLHSSENDSSYDESRADTSSYNRNYSGSDFTRSSGRSSYGSYGSSYGSSRGSYGRNGRQGQTRSRGERSGSDRSERYDRDRSRRSEKSYSDRGDRGNYGSRGYRGEKNYKDRDYSYRDRYDRSSIDVDYTEAYAAAAAAAAAANNKPQEPKVKYTEEQIAQCQSRADQFLTSMFQSMGMEVRITYHFDEEENIFTVDFEGDEMGVLIGKRGQTLDSIQYLVSLVVNKDLPGYIHVKADTENYRERRRKTLENLARNMAAKVKRTHRAQALEPMNPYERRIIHSALQGDRYVTTYSEGEDPNRRVVIIPKEGM